MCVAFWSLTHSEYALILCTNRDEFLDRPTAPAHFHAFGNVGTDGKPGEGNVLSGRDLQAGGTWLGITRTGRFALLTNITEPTSSYKSSRGHLVTSFLAPTSSQHVRSLANEVEDLLSERQDTPYAGFNMLLLAPRGADLPDNRTTATSPHNPLSFSAELITNHGGGGSLVHRPLEESERHCGGMSNGVDGRGASEWPKVVRGTQSLQEILESLPTQSTEGYPSADREAQTRRDDELAESLFRMLEWRSDPPPVDRGSLRNTIHIAPLPIDPKAPIKGANVTAATTGVSSTHETSTNTTEEAKVSGRRFYGTRLSTVVLVRRDGQVRFLERDTWMLGKDSDVVRGEKNLQRDYTFSLQLP